MASRLRRVRTLVAIKALNVLTTLLRGLAALVQRVK
jgi:hypothetical protein